MKLSGITKADLILVITITVCSLAVFVASRLFTSAGSAVEIRSGDDLIITHPLEEDKIVEINGPLGTAIIEISNKHVRVVSAPCNDKICMHMGSIGRLGGVLVCIPNRVWVTVVNNKNDSVDAMTR
jgi:hypothetical protein